MLIIAVLIGILLLGLWLQEFGNCSYGSLGDMLTFFSSTILISVLIALPLSRMVDKSFIQEYAAIKDTINSNNFTALDRAALTQKVIDINRDIVSKKYYNSTVFDIFIVDEAANLETIK